MTDLFNLAMGVANSSLSVDGVESQLRQATRPV